MRVKLAFLLELGLKAICIGLAHIRILGNVKPGLTNKGGGRYKNPELGREAEQQSAHYGLNDQFPSSVLTTAHRQTSH